MVFDFGDKYKLKNEVVPEGCPMTEPERQLFFANEILKENMAELKEGDKLPTYHVETFGCQMNAKDSEKIAGILELAGYTEAEDERADIVVYNTCTVRENANLKVYGRLGYLKKLKEKNPRMIIAMCGCMPQEPKVVEKLKQSYRFVDIVFGTFNIYKVAELIYVRRHRNKMVIDVEDKSPLIVENLPSSHKYSFKAGVNIMYGCNNFCTFCIVPLVRGREKSRKPQDIIHECRSLAKQGVKEIMLLGQNVDSYGMTLDPKVKFSELLEEVEKVEGIKRIRFMSPNPEDFADEVIEVMAKSKKIEKHVHMPLQSGSDRILKRMNRNYTKQQFLDIVNKIKEKIPGVELTTDIIVGFPGETEEDFLDTMDVCEKVGFASAYTFIYSKRTGTPAALMEDQVPEDVVSERFDRLLKVVQRKSAEVAEKYVGSVVEVLVEEKDTEPGMLTGRLSNNMLVHFKADESLLGEFVNVHIDESKGFYFFGSLVAPK